MRTGKFKVLGSPLTVTSTDVFTNGVDINQQCMYAVQAVWTGLTLAGTIKLQASIINAYDLAGGPYWSDIPNSAQNVSGPNSFIWQIDFAAYEQFRLYFAYGSGTGTINVFATIKGS